MTGWEWGSIASLAIGDVLLLRAFLRWDQRRLAKLMPLASGQGRLP